VRHHRYHRQGGSGPGLIEGLRRLEYRGYDSAGIATLVDGQIECRRMARSAHRRLGQGNYECYRQLAEAAEQRRKTATHPKRTGSRLDGMARREEQIELNRGGSFAEVCTPDVFRVAPRAGATTELILAGDRGFESCSLQRRVGCEPGPGYLNGRRWDAVGDCPHLSRSCIIGNAPIDSRSGIESRRQTGQMMEFNRALIKGARMRGGRVKGVTRCVESVVNTQFSCATLTERCASGYSLRRILWCSVNHKQTYAGTG
jgi:hypothetical protein